MANIGVEAVGETKIDDPVNGTEGDRGLGPISSQRIEPFAAAACKDDSQDFHGKPSSEAPRPQRLCRNSKKEGEAVGFQSFRMRVF
jgi:hypothetical protein